jgi:hypothetical protein
VWFRYQLGETLAPGVIDDDHFSAGECFDGMERISGNDAGVTGTIALGYAIDSDFELALDDFINLFLRVRMLMDSGPASNS